VIYSHKYKYVFISVPKCGSCTMIQHLKDHYEGQTEYNGLPLHMHENKIPFDAEGYTIFSIVRNPYERAISSWWSARIKEPAWEVCSTKDPVTFLTAAMSLDTYHPRIIPAYLQLREHPDILLLKLESLEQEFGNLPFTTGEHIIKLNSKKDRPQLKDMPDGFIDCVNHYYIKDFKLGGYNVST